MYVFPVCLCVLNPGELEGHEDGGSGAKKLCDASFVQAKALLAGSRPGLARQVMRVQCVVCSVCNVV